MNLKSGSIIRNPESGEAGIVKNIDYDKDTKKYHIIVKTLSGRRKWTFIQKSKTIFEKILEFIRK